MLLETFNLGVKDVDDPSWVIPNHELLTLRHPPYSMLSDRDSMRSFGVYPCYVHQPSDTTVRTQHVQKRTPRFHRSQRRGPCISDCRLATFRYGGLPCRSTSRGPHSCERPQSPEPWCSRPRRSKLAEGGNRGWKIPSNAQGRDTEGNLHFR